MDMQFRIQVDSLGGESLPYVIRMGEGDGPFDFCLGQYSIHVFRSNNFGRYCLSQYRKDGSTRSCLWGSRYIEETQSATLGRAMKLAIYLQQRVQNGRAIMLPEGERDTHSIELRFVAQKQERVSASV